VFVEVDVRVEGGLLGGCGGLWTVGDDVSGRSRQGQWCVGVWGEGGLPAQLGTGEARGIGGMCQQGGTPTMYHRPGGCYKYGIKGFRLVWGVSWCSVRGSS
jgi:hypothetical protein